MDRKQFREAAFAKALQAGCTGAELVVTGGEEFGAGVQAGKLDTYTVSRTQAFGLRVQYKGKNGYASTEAPEDPGALVAAAMDNAAAVETLTGEELQALDFTDVRGIAGIKEASYEVAGMTVKVAVASASAVAPRARMSSFTLPSARRERRRSISSVSAGLWSRGARRPPSIM